jgi:hypothetical protein
MERKVSMTKKIKLVSKSEEEIKMQKLDVLVNFGLSPTLINLFRNPQIEYDNTFHRTYL